MTDPQAMSEATADIIIGPFDDLPTIQIQPQPVPDDHPDVARGRHAAWEDGEDCERMAAEFTAGIAELDELVHDIRAALTALEALR